MAAVAVAVAVAAATGRPIHFLPPYANSISNTHRNPKSLPPSLQLQIRSSPSSRRLPLRRAGVSSPTDLVISFPLSSSNPQLRNRSSHSSVFPNSPGLLLPELRVVRNGVGRGDEGGGGGSGLGGGGGGEDTRGRSGGDGEDSNNGFTFNPLKTLVLWLGYWSSRVAADPQFPSRVLMVGITASVSGYVVGNMAASQGRNELDSTLGVGYIVGGFTLMGLLGLMFANDPLASFVCKATVSAAAVFAVWPDITKMMRKPNKPALTMVEAVTGAICAVIFLRPMDLLLLYNPNFHMALLGAAVCGNAALSAYNDFRSAVARARLCILLLSVATFCLLFP